MMNCDFAPMSIDVFCFFLRGQSDPPKKSCVAFFNPYRIQQRAREQPCHLSNEKRAPGCLGKRGLYYPVIWGLLKNNIVRIPIKQPVY